MTDVVRERLMVVKSCFSSGEPVIGNMVSELFLHAAEERKCKAFITNICRLKMSNVLV